MSNPKQAPAGSGHPVGGPARSERPVDVPGGFNEDESMEEEISPFIRKVDTNGVITTRDISNWAKDLDSFVKDINIVAERYREGVTKAVSYKKKYGDAKGAFENNQLHLVTLEEKHTTLQEEYEKLKEDN